MNEVHYFGADGCALFAALVSGSSEHAAETDESVVLVLHCGGPDHQSLVPLARRTGGVHPVVLPDVRGYGKSICRNPSCYTWTQYAQDVIALLDELGVRKAILGGAGLGATICLSTAVAYPDRFRALLLISVEDIEVDEAKQAEVAFMDAFAERVRLYGIEAVGCRGTPHSALR
ncbi:acyl-CoA esterase [Anatilimnocola aggregata]|uniref:Acyl-CoA esterase n=1 Tax=Anatilimnocola aggregata TaxID=2528021 RepID=A0A517Y8V0_9BACT|nr:alpha/beta fold hydrolase [Anatilimnocola aggregata]QDU26667.1 acyl-CoA esterase [Anatilimnocola aggregata]